MKIKPFLFGSVQLKNTFYELGLVVPRLIVGLSIALAHGLGKFPPPDRLVEGVGALGFPAPTFFAWAASCSELFGGILLAIGLLTRPAAILVAITMAVAAFMAHKSDPYSVKEMAILYFSLSWVYAFLGGGRFSVDSFLRKK